MTDLELFQILKPIISYVTGIQNVVFGDQNAITHGEYASVRVRSNVDATARGNIRTEYDKARQKIKTTIKSPVTYRVSVNAYRCSNPVEKLSRLINCSRLPSVHMRLLSARLGWCGNDPVVNLTEEQSNRTEYRAAIVFRLVGTQETSDEWNTIEQMPPIRVFNEKNQLIHEEK